MNEYEKENNLLKKEIEYLKEVIRYKDIEINNLKKNDKVSYTSINYGYLKPK